MLYSKTFNERLHYKQNHQIILIDFTLKVKHAL